LIKGFGTPPVNGRVKTELLHPNASVFPSGDRLGSLTPPGKSRTGVTRIVCAAAKHKISGANFM
jgi:hypothetical protein